jgi:hypothetical protein
MDAAYTNHWEGLMGVEEMAFWIHGHARIAADYDVDDKRVVCNPRGSGRKDRFLFGCGNRDIARWCNARTKAHDSDLPSHVLSKKAV